MPPISEQEHAVPSEGVACLIPQHGTSRTLHHSALAWKTQGSPLKMVYPAPRSIRMNWSVWLRVAGFTRESRQALNKFFFHKKRHIVVAEVVSSSLNRAAIAERPMAMPAMGCARGGCSPSTGFPSVQLLGELPLGLIKPSAHAAKLPR